MPATDLLQYLQKTKRGGGVPAYQNGLDITLNTTVSAPDLQLWKKVYVPIHWEKSVFSLALQNGYKIGLNIMLGTDMGQFNKNQVQIIKKEVIFVFVFARYAHSP